jgi:hypothetical protein
MQGINNTFLVSGAVMFPIALLVFLFCPETTYSPRMKLLEHDFQENHTDVPEQMNATTTGIAKTDGESKEAHIIERELTSSNGSVEQLGQVEAKKTFKQDLKIFHGRLTNRSFFATIWLPFPLLVFPAVVFTSVVSGAFATWTIVSSIVSFQALSGYPYWMPPDKLSLIGIPGTFTVLIVNVIAGWSSDKLITFIARRNKGIYEPEYRLWLMVPAVFFSTLSFFGTGWVLSEKKSVKYLIIVGLGHYIAGPFASAATLTYVMDCQTKNAAEAFVSSTLARSVFGFLALEYSNELFTKYGPTRFFRVLALLNLGISLLTIPMYIFGKRFRGVVSLFHPLFFLRGLV